MINLDQKMPGEVAAEVAKRVRARRKERGFTQEQLARKAGMSLSSYKRFERDHQIAFSSLVNIAFALGCEDDFAMLFAQPHYASIDDVVKASQAAARVRRSSL